MKLMERWLLVSGRLGAVWTRCRHLVTHDWPGERVLCGVGLSLTLAPQSLQPVSFGTARVRGAPPRLGGGALSETRPRSLASPLGRRRTGEGAPWSWQSCEGRGRDRCQNLGHGRAQNPCEARPRHVRRAR